MSVTYGTRMKNLSNFINIIENQNTTENPIEWTNKNETKERKNKKKHKILESNNQKSFCWKINGNATRWRISTLLLEFLLNFLVALFRGCTILPNE